MSDSPAAEIRRPLARRLVLGDFRSYAALDLEISGQLVVLCGDNGAGKTNVLEALSLLTAGRGLRRADLRDCAREGGAGGFAVSVEIDSAYGAVQLGTGLNGPGSPSPQSRKCRIDRAPVSSIRAFADHVRVVWLTPAMDGLFTGSPGDRRRFLDRLVLSIDAEHGTRVNAMERALRNRNRLLEEGTRDTAWLDAAEREVAELGLGVAQARRDTVAHLSALIAAERDDSSAFPWAEVALTGEIDVLMEGRSQAEAEETYRRILRNNRGRDAAAGRTLVGPQGSDLSVRHGPKNTEAARASTGEQKALLVGLVLANARLVASMSGIAPFVLLDEIAAHFDPKRRAALYEALARLGGQVWMSGADRAAFAEAGPEAQVFEVKSGLITPV